MLPALNEITDIQEKPNLQRKLATDMLLDYTQTYPYENISYYTINMILHVEFYATDLFIPGACSHIYGHYYLSDHNTNPTNPSDVYSNGPFITECKNLQHVVRSTAEAKTGGIFINGQKIEPIRTAFIQICDL